VARPNRLNVKYRGFGEKLSLTVGQDVLRSDGDRNQSGAEVGQDTGQVA
jgi:hypothetical protein